MIANCSDPKIFPALSVCSKFFCHVIHPTEFLPLNCNWIASNLLPKFDEIKNKFVEPYLPNYEIGIMHLAAGIWDGDKDMRLDKEVMIEVETLQKKSLTKSLRFGY